MNNNDERRNEEGSGRAGGLLTGAVLILVGMLFLLDRMDLFEVGRVWTWWPLLPIGFGLAKLAGARGHDETRSAIWLVLAGSWMLISTKHWFGFHWGNSWPLLLIALGVVTVWQALAERSSRNRDKDEVSRES